MEGRTPPGVTGPKAGTYPGSRLRRRPRPGPRSGSLVRSDRTGVRGSSSVTPEGLRLGIERDGVYGCRSFCLHTSLRQSFILDSVFYNQFLHKVPYKLNHRRYD